MKKYFTRGEDAVRETLKFVEVCLEVGGIPHLRSKYGGFPFRERLNREKILRGIKLVCYGRAEYIPSETVFAPVDDRLWQRFVKTVEDYVGDYKIVAEEFPEYAPSPEEVKRYLIRLGITPEEAEKLSKMPIYGRK